MDKNIKEYVLWSTCQMLRAARALELVKAGATISEDFYAKGLDQCAKAGIAILKEVDPEVLYEVGVLKREEDDEEDDVGV